MPELTLPVGGDLELVRELAGLRMYLERIADSVSRGEDWGSIDRTDLASWPDGGTYELDLGRRVSAALVDVIRGLAAAPRYLIAKGGITSNDLALKAFGATVNTMTLGGLAIAIGELVDDADSHITCIVRDVTEARRAEAAQTAAAPARLDSALCWLPMPRQVIALTAARLIRRRSLYADCDSSAPRSGVCRFMLAPLAAEVLRRSNRSRRYVAMQA